VFAMGGLSPAIAERIPIQFSALATFALLWTLVSVPSRDAASSAESISLGSETEPAATAAR
jgi:hypothetical protein